MSNETEADSRAWWHEFANKPAIIQRWGKIALIVYILLFVGYGIAVYIANIVGGLPKVPEGAGFFGDMFGAFNAFVAGVAMLGVIAALVIQQAQLGAQISEMKRSSIALDKSQAALVKSVDVSAFVAARGILQEESVRAARRYVMDELKKKPFSEWILNVEDVKHAEIVCHTFDTIGQMVRHKMVPRHYIVDDWERSLLETWSVLGDLVRHYRKTRDFEDYWDDYEWLVACAQEKRLNKSTAKKLSA